MRILVIGALLVVVACGGGGATTPPTVGGGLTPAPVASGELPSAEQLCELLTADDWGQFNYVTAAEPTINDLEGPGTAYCVYAGDSGATGGLEFDAFVADSEEEAQATLETITDGFDTSPTELPEADAALITGEGEYAAIVVRTGRFTFTIALPAGDQAETQLTTLANSVISRSAAYR